MKGLSVHQPYASLLAWGAKRYETRGWRASYTGWLAIHAGKSMEVLLDIAEELSAFAARREDPSLLTLFFLDVLDKRGVDRSQFSLNDLPRGAIVGVAKLTGYHSGSALLPTLTAQEKAFGYFDERSEARFGWCMESALALTEPIEFRGQQGLFDIPESVVKEIQRQWLVVKNDTRVANGAQQPAPPNRKKVAIVGSRNYPRLDLVRQYVASLAEDTVVVSGGARGVDETAEQAARERGLQVESRPANWEHGKLAGFRRNSEIVAAADEVVAFWHAQSRGTFDTITKARKTGKPVLIFDSEGNVVNE